MGAPSGRGAGAGERRSGVQRILVATDLSSRSEPAVRRAAMLAQQHAAEFLVLHVVDEDQPAVLAEPAARHARALLEEQVRAFGASAPERVEVRVVAGDPFAGILEAAAMGSAELVVMGAHRRRLVGEIFTGTTLERVVRMGSRPVLTVSRRPAQPYSRVIAAVDFSAPAAHALRALLALRLGERAAITVLHAFEPLAKTRMASAGVAEATLRRHTEQAAQAARKALAELLAALEPREQPLGRLVEEGLPAEVIRRVAEREGADLVVIGTRGHTGLKRLLLGSVADALLRELACDVLAVPPPVPG